MSQYSTNIVSRHPTSISPTTSLHLVAPCSEISTVHHERWSHSTPRTVFSSLAPQLTFVCVKMQNVPPRRRPYRATCFSASQSSMHHTFASQLFHSPPTNNIILSRQADNLVYGHKGIISGGTVNSSIQPRCRKLGQLHSSAWYLSPLSFSFFVQPPFVREAASAWASCTSFFFGRLLPLHDLHSFTAILCIHQSLSLAALPSSQLYTTLNSPNHDNGLHLL